MLSKRFPTVAALAAGLLLATQGPVHAAPQANSNLLVIGVDHEDGPNQQPGNHRVFEYTDFFSRSVRVHKGDTLDFRTAPGAFHIVALSGNEAAARSTYPVALLDPDDPNAIGSGQPKIQLGPSNGSITNGSASHDGGTIGDPNAFPPDNCGLVQFGQSPCTFSGPDDVESQGGVAGFGQNGPQAVDWAITINADLGTYAYFCFIHPGMRGSVTVVGAEAPATTPLEVSDASHAQFVADRDAALAAESAANVVTFSGGGPGTRTYNVKVGLSAANNHVAIDEMLPQRLNLTKGDRVAYRWPDPHNVHTVGFPAASPPLPGPFGPEFEDGESQEVVGDPGSSPPNSLLTDPNALVDAGLRLGTAYGVQPTSQTWSVRTNTSTATGLYQYQCTVHDFMRGMIAVSP